MLPEELGFRLVADEVTTPPRNRGISCVQIEPTDRPLAPRRLLLLNSFTDIGLYLEPVLLLSITANVISRSPEFRDFCCYHVVADSRPSPSLRPDVSYHINCQSQDCVRIQTKGSAPLLNSLPVQRHISPFSISIPLYPSVSFSPSLIHRMARSLSRADVGERVACG